MASTAVSEILQRIDELPEADRALLEEQLAQRAQGEWAQEATKAREIARQRGVDQGTIDRAVEQVRCGPRRGVP